MDNQQMNNQVEEQLQAQANAQQQQNYNVQQPQQPLEAYMPRPRSFLGLALFTPLCCCLPFGIVAIIKGNSVSSLYASKQYNAALAASNEAKNWCIYGIVAYFVIGAILSLIGLIGGVGALSFLPFSDILESVIGG